MADLWAAGVGFVLLIVLMGLGLHVAFVMFALSIAGAALYLGSPIVMENGTQNWSSTNNFVLVAVPLFVMLGELLVRGGFTDRMYRSLSDWLAPLPGGPVFEALPVDAPAPEADPFAPLPGGPVFPALDDAIDAAASASLPAFEPAEAIPAFEATPAF